MILSNAGISPDGLYRYYLTRIWDAGLPMLGWIMLNPSTADAEQDDPTIRKCMGFASRLKCGGIWVCNLFAYRTTFPRGLYTTPGLAAIGPDNAYHTHRMIESCPVIICGWGNHGGIHGQGDAMRTRLKAYPYKAFALAINKDGSPKHPLYVKYNTTPVLYS